MCTQEVGRAIARVWPTKAGGEVTAVKRAKGTHRTVELEGPCIPLQCRNMQRSHMGIKPGRAIAQGQNICMACRSNPQHRQLDLGESQAWTPGGPLQVRVDNTEVCFGCFLFFLPMYLKATERCLSLMKQRGYQKTQLHLYEYGNLFTERAAGDLPYDPPPENDVLNGNYRKTIQMTAPSS